LSDPAVNIPSGRATRIIVAVVVIESFVAPTSRRARYREDTLEVPLQSEQA